MTTQDNAVKDGEMRPCFYDPSHTLEIYSFNQDGQGHHDQTHGVRCTQCNYESISINEWNSANCWKLLDEAEKKAKAYRNIALKLHMKFDCSGKEMMCAELIDREAERLMRERNDEC